MIDLSSLVKLASIFEGMVVLDVPEGSLFELAGLAFGDIVISINDENIQSPDDYLDVSNSLDFQDLIKIECLRNNQVEYIWVKSEVPMDVVFGSVCFYDATSDPKEATIN